MSAPFAVSALTLFPEAFPGTLALSVIGRALRDGVWTLQAVDIRAFATDKHRTVDDAPFGGGPGLVMRPDIAAAAIDSIPRNDRPLIYLSPRGKPLTQALAQEWARGPGLIVFCGRFEGLDERVIAARGMQEVSVGDAVLAGGEAAALVLIEAAVRLLPGVLGNADSAAQDSFSDGLLEHPHFTKPRVWEGRAVPDVLLSGDHGAIAAWRRAERERLTRERRPDLAAPPRET
ncbi:MAG: tRNA (guanosine(37)-N1)-methyltransferase TrmD [Hyphomonadaceae bacterium]|nr:tRNA (guanosine(37)-N1)-methyltransferase TrmD [Hyphomonadaceae bacterium]